MAQTPKKKRRKLPATLVNKPDRDMLDAVLGKRVMRAAEQVAREQEKSTMKGS